MNKQTDSNVDYPGAVDCIVTPSTLYDCNAPNSLSNCAYNSSDRPTSCTVQTVVTTPCNIYQVVIHDTEGSLSSALNSFWCLSNSTNRSACQQKSVQYIIDTDGTVYQVLSEKDIAYHDGNFWSNTHSIGIEHIGVDATGYLWYNATQYTASAKLTAYLLKKYHLQLNRDHVVAHGTVPASKMAESPNHVDPGPYWLWDYYFTLISQQGVPLNIASAPGTITLHPTTDQSPAGSGGAETSANYNFFKLYTGPGTNTGLIPAQNTSDPIDTSYNVEAGMSYYYIAKAPDAAGTGATMYEIWYGEENLVHASPSSYYANASVAWLAVPPGAGIDQGQSSKPGTFYSTSLVEVTGAAAQVYGEPVSNSLYVIGASPVGAIFYSGYTVTEDHSGNMWYEINFNHRHAWLPASEVTAVHP